LKPRIEAISLGKERAKAAEADIVILLVREDCETANRDIFVRPRVCNCVINAVSE